MKTTTKLLGLSLAGAGLLMSACELPGGGQPARTIVIPNPSGDTPFHGFPATFKGTNLVREATELSAQGLTDSYDTFRTTVDGELDLVISCDVADEGTWVYVWSDTETLSEPCPQGSSYEVTVAGETVVEIGNEGDPGLHAYVVRADIDDTTTGTVVD